MSEQKQHHLQIRRLGSVSHNKGDTLILAEYEDGSLGTIRVTADLGGQLIHKLQEAYLSPIVAIPELDALRFGAARDSKGHLLLKIDTAQAHSICVRANPSLVERLRELLEKFDDLSVLEDPSTN